jgi:hypothetical protein
VRLGSVFAAVALAAGIVTAAPAQAVDPAPETSTPVVTDPVWQKVLPDRQLVTVSDQYAMHRRSWSRDGQYAGFTIVRLSDGAVVSEFRNSGFPGSSLNSTRLEGGALLLEYGPSDDDRGHVDFVDPETLAVEGKLVAPLGEAFVAAGHNWMLTLWWPTPDRFSGRLRFLDGTTLDVTFPGDAVTGGSRIVGTIGSVVYLQHNSTLAALDLATGSVTRLVGPRADSIYPFGFWHSPFVSGDRIVQLEHDWSNDSYAAVWYDAATLTEHRTPLELPGEGQLYPFGNDLIQAVGPDGATKTLYGIDLDAGVVTGPLDHALDVAENGSGGLVVTVDGDPDDALGVMVDDTGVQPVTVLPRVPEAMSSPYLDGHSLSALVGANNSWPMSTRADATAGWTHEDHRFTTAGDVRLEEIPDPLGYPTSQWQLSWPGGSRIIHANRVVLGHGGELVVVDYSTIQRVRPADDGSVVEVASPFGPAKAVADGSWVWLPPGANHVVRGFDAEDPSRTRELDAGVGCSPGTLEARDGFMLMTCSLGWSYVIDLSGKLPTWRVPISTINPVTPRLGNGFIVWTYFNAWTPERDAFTDLRVADLTAEHRTTSIRDVGGSGRSMFIADEAGGKRVAYVNNSGLVAVRDVTRADTTPPVLTVGQAGETEYVASETPVDVHFSESWSDPVHGIESASGVATIDVRTRIRTSATYWSAWQTTEGLDAATGSEQVHPGTGVCFSSRARDLAGNLSVWSEPRCTVVDAAAPTLEQVTGPAKFAMADPDGRIRFGYGASDDFGVASYDVQTRAAKPGQVLGPWTHQLSATTANELSTAAAAGSERCVRFRARDLAGHVTAWSPPRCTAVGYDDRALDVAGATARRTSALALNRTVTVLKRTGATASLARVQKGTTLGVWVLRGPDQGTLDVRVGTTSIGRIRAAAPTWRRSLVELSLPTSGSVRFTSASSRAVRLDGLAVLR